jgi:hypothetical protein
MIGPCNYDPYTLADVETKTVTFINMPNNTITEISPQSGCGTISQYETLISSLVSYVNSHATNPGYRWGGIMLDEEAGSASDCGAQGWGFTAGQLQTLNNWLANYMVYTPGGEWYYTEDSVPQGCWNQSTFNNVVGYSLAAEQSVSGYMVQLINGYVSTNAGTVMVTWSYVYPCPYCSEHGSVDPINGAPYGNWGFNWANQFQGA